MNEEPQNTSPTQSSEVSDKHAQEEEKARKEGELYLRKFFSAARRFIGKRLSIIDNADPKATIEGIENDVEFKGFNLWILIFSIFICSIGLNVDSDPVIIGAMLISPLMGPIMGVGLSIGINDIELLKRSLRNWGVAVGMALAASIAYFLVAPDFGTADNLLARTQPTLLDVLIAVFGGAAGILAGSRKAKSNVVPGVAIATALMPPLCTAGYGIATGNMLYFLGAIYLFLINSIFISLTTTLVVRYLQFPLRKLADPAKERKRRRLISAILVIFILPSGYVFYSVVSKAVEEQSINTFIAEEIHVDGAVMMPPSIERLGDETVVTLSFIGEQATPELIQSWERKLEQHELDHVVLNITQYADRDDYANGEEMQRIVTSMVETQKTLEGKDREIERLRTLLEDAREAGLPAGLIDEIKINNPEISEVYAGQLQLSSARQDTICTLVIKFDENLEMTENTSQAIKTRLASWIKIRLESDTVFITEL